MMVTGRSAAVIVTGGNAAVIVTGWNAAIRIAATGAGAGGTVVVIDVSGAEITGNNQINTE
jgi:hypothetical protein